MANTLNLNNSVTANINGLSINESSNTSLVPSGSAAYGESLLINTGTTYQLITTGSTFGTASVIYVANSSQSGSISIAVSASNAVSFLGTILPNPTAGGSNATSIQWNQPFSGLYALAGTSASYG